MRQIKLNSWFWSIGLLGICGLIAIYVIAYATQWGPVIFSDAAGYITIGRNILAGKGIGGFNASGRFDLLTYQPPLYPILLASLGLLGADLVDVARWLNAVLLAGAIILMGVIAYRLSPRRSIAILLTTAACGVALSSPVLVGLYSTAMSEPTFIFFSLLGMVLLLRYAETDAIPWLIASAIFTGLALMTRYIGAAFVLAGSLCILWLTPGGWRRKWGRVVLWGVTASAMMLIWLIWASVQPGVESPRRVQENIHLLQRLNEARVLLVDIFWKWLPFATNLHLPYRLRLFTMALPAVGMLVVLFLAFKNMGKGGVAGFTKSPITRTSAVLILYIAAYIVTLTGMFVYSNPPPDFDDRMLLPVYWLSILLIFVSFAVLQNAWPRHKWLYLLPMAGLGLFAVAFVPQTRALVAGLHQNGDGYLSVRTRNSPLLQAVRELPADILIISNSHTEVSFLADRPCYAIMEVVQLKPQPLDSRFGDDPAEDAQAVFRKGGALVLFNSFRWQIESLYGEQTPQRVQAFTRDLMLYGEYADGAIYFYPTEPGGPNDDLRSSQP